jgi:hypothetical protein
VVYSFWILKFVEFICNIKFFSTVEVFEIFWINRVVFYTKWILVQADSTQMPGRLNNRVTPLMIFWRGRLASYSWWWYFVRLVKAQGGVIGEINWFDDTIHLFLGWKKLELPSSMDLQDCTRSPEDLSCGSSSLTPAGTKTPSHPPTTIPNPSPRAVDDNTFRSRQIGARLRSPLRLDGGDGAPPSPRPHRRRLLRHPRLRHLRGPSRPRGLVRYLACGPLRSGPRVA